HLGLHFALDLDFPTIANLADIRHFSADLGNRRLPLRIAGLKQLLHPGQTLGDVVPGHTAGMEGAHGELGSRLPDGLGGNNSDRFPDLHLGTEGQISAVTHLAHPVAGPAGEDGANLHFLDAGIHDASSDVLVDHLVPLDDHFSGLRVANGLEGDPADDSVVKLLDHFALVFDPADG